jgi:hypothetical protein
MISAKHIAVFTILTDIISNIVLKCRKDLLTNRLKTVHELFCEKEHETFHVLDTNFKRQSYPK